MTFYSKSRLIILMACAYSLAANAALVEKSSKPAGANDNIITAAEQILHNANFDQIDLTSDNLERVKSLRKAHLQRIAQQEQERKRLKNTPEFIKDAKLLGLIEYLDSGNQNPLHVPGVARKIMDFLGIPYRPFVPCPDRHDRFTNRTYAK